MERILMVMTTDVGFNGITSVVMNYYRNINREKIQFDFAICERINNNIEYEIEKLGGKVFKLPSRKKFTCKYIKALKQLVKEKKYKIVHVHGNSGTLYLDIHALKKAGVLIRIAHSHNSTCNHKIIHKLFKNKLNREMTMGIACSKLAGDWLFNRDYTIINNGIDIDKFTFRENIRNKYRHEMKLEGKFVIGHIGHFSYQKNHEYLINVFKKVYDKDKEAILMLIGDGKLRAKIEEQIYELGLKDNVLLLGKRDDVAELMQAMDVFVFPSRFEGLPVVLIETQAAGLKCIISNNITKECKVTDNVKYLDLKKDDTEWVNTILSVSKNYERNNVRQRLFSSSFNIKREIKKLEEIYLSKI
ncbi:glycosyltransferase family 1 protein [Clostridium isatidis]|uniref:Glycosyl transferase family 1 n=1 Tax=Clostridium isatidis TaxID=182773 RepID=A0A343JA68_9CLOT|nr:glycosyltransferase family 1 protein [Clostridium isatidis]ASW42426.1 hypothetical protein BEN51_02690 [Clostridium isatidis]